MNPSYLNVTQCYVYRELMGDAILRTVEEEEHTMLHISRTDAETLTREATLVDPDLLNFLNSAHENEIACISRHSRFLEIISEVKIILSSMFAELVNQKPVPVTLMMHSYAYFLSAVRIAMSGQAPPAIAVLRACIESSLYALIAARSPENATLYLERKKNLGKCKDTFKPSVAIKILRKIDPNLAILFDQLYTTSIELGAHPNRDSLIPYISMNERNGTHDELEIAILLDPSSQKVTATLVACCETGFGLLLIAKHLSIGYSPAIDAHHKALKLWNDLREISKSFSCPDSE